MTHNSSIIRAVQHQMMSHYPSESAIQLESLSSDEAADILHSVDANSAAQVLSFMSSQSVEKILTKLGHGQAVELLNLMLPKKIAYFLGYFDSESRTQYLEKLNPDLSTEVKELLQYLPNTAGSIMDTQFVMYRPDMTIHETLNRFRESKKSGRRVIFLTDNDHRLQGLVEIQDILMVSPDTKLSSISKPIVHFAHETSLREEVVDILSASKLSELPVVNLKGELVGIIRYDALVQAAQEDATADIQTMVGASKDERALSKISFAVKKRLPWLEINLVTAFIAASVVGFFEGTIAQYTALAILLPVVAGQSGNTGAQALAVTMRGLALREVRPKHWPQILLKEANVGLINGIAVALTTAIGVYLWSHSTGLALIICLSMIISMVLACISGAMVPIVLAKLGQDPAQSSSIILTTITDVVGFFSFLGIATLLITLL